MSESAALSSPEELIESLRNVFGVLDYALLTAPPYKSHRAIEEGRAVLDTLLSSLQAPSRAQTASVGDTVESLFLRWVTAVPDVQRGAHADLLLAYRDVEQALFAYRSALLAGEGETESLRALLPPAWLVV